MATGYWGSANLDDEEWDDMPIILPESDGLDREEEKDDGRKNSYRNYNAPARLRADDYASTSSSSALAGGAAVGNATGKLLDIDAVGQEWREKGDVEEMDYTRLELDDDPEEDEISMRTQYLFNEDKGMTPLSQMQATKTLLTEGQRIAYVGLCRLVAREMVQTLALAAKGAKELDPARDSAQTWAVKIMGRLYRHMEVDAAEQRMIEQLAEHGVTAEDLVPSLATTHTVDNPEYDPDYVPSPEETTPVIPQEPSVAIEVTQEGDEDGKRKSDVEEVHETEEEAETRKRLEREAEEEELGRVAREVARIERRASAAADPFGQYDDGYSSPTSPKSVRSFKGVPRSPTSPSKRSQSFRSLDFDEEAEGDIGGALDVPRSTSPSPLTTPTSPPTIPTPSTPPRISTKLPSSPDATVATPKITPTSPTTPRADDSFNTPLPSSLPGVSKTLTAADKTVTLDIRWTILCDLFLSLIADSVYDARSRVLLGRLAEKLGLEWMDVVRFERRLTEALEIQESVKEKEHGAVLEGQRIKGKRQRYMMMGLATLGGGLVIGLSAGLLAPVIGAGLGAAFTTIGVTGTSSFLAGAGGAALISSGATISGSIMGGKAMARRTRHVRTFEFLPLHNNKRVNYYITVPGFMSGPLDDVRLPFSTIDPVVGDVFSVLWEPDMMGDTGNALKILTSEVLTQVGQQVLAATVMTALLSALQWPLMLSKLGYLIDNPWSNALDRARQAGAVLADILINRRLGVRPVSLVGFSLGARVIFFALIELAKANAFGVVQEVYLFGATLTASKKVWRQVRGVVSGRFVNAFAMNDWVLGYLFRATSGGLQTVAGLRPIEHVPDLENIDITHILVGHMSYRTLMPQLLEYVGFKTTADHFDEPEEMEMDAPDREVLTREEEERRREKKERGKFGFFKRKKAGNGTDSAAMSRNPSSEYDLPPRMSSGSTSSLPEGLRNGEVPRSRSSLSVVTPDEKPGRASSEGEPEKVEEEEEREEPAKQKEKEKKVPPAPTPPASIPVGFDIAKLREEAAALASSNSSPTSASHPSTTTTPAPPSNPADLTNLDTTLDPHELLRRQWALAESTQAPQPRSAATYEGVDDWAPQPLGNLPSLGGEAPITFTFGGDEGGWGAPTSSRDAAPTFEDDDAPDPAGTLRWGRVNESTASLRPQNPW